MEKTIKDYEIIVSKFYVKEKVERILLLIILLFCKEIR